jgi:nucleoside 2-deoxyribosyltransferase
VDDSLKSTPIIPDIKEWLAKADLVIADLTNVNPNVYYEVGYADALNKKLILVAQTGTVLGFNISNIRTLFYDNPEDLQQQLRDAIDEAI